MNNSPPAGRQGVSIIELLLTISLVAIIGASATPVYTNFLARNYLENKTNEVISSLQTAKTNSISGKEDSSWGVYLTSEITLFKGSTYATRDAAFDQTYPIPISITVSGISEIVFGQPVGDPNLTGTITIANNQNESNTLTINQFGTINVN